MSDDPVLAGITARWYATRLRANAYGDVPCQLPLVEMLLHTVSQAISSTLRGPYPRRRQALVRQYEIPVYGALLRLVGGFLAQPKPLVASTGGALLAPRAPQEPVPEDPTLQSVMRGAIPDALDPSYRLSVFKAAAHALRGWINDRDTPADLVEQTLSTLIPSLYCFGTLADDAALKSNVAEVTGAVARALARYVTRPGQSAEDWVDRLRLVVRERALRAIGRWLPPDERRRIFSILSQQLGALLGHLPEGRVREADGVAVFQGFEEYVAPALLRACGDRPADWHLTEGRRWSAYVDRAGKAGLADVLAGSCLACRTPVLQALTSDEVGHRPVLAMLR